MNYIEYLRMRRNLTWYTGVLGALALVSLLTFNLNAAHMQAGHGFTHDRVDWAALFGLALGSTLIFATIIGGTLSRENETPEMIRTKPFPLERIALGFFLTDLATILIAFVIALALTLVVLFDAFAVAHAGSPSLYAGPLTGLIPALGIGISFMWYAEVQAVSSGLRGRGGTTIGLSWACFVILGGAAGAPFLPTPIHDVIVAVNVLNPLAYMDSLTTHGSNLSSPTANSIFTIGPWIRAGIVWAIAIAACALATYNWKRLEF